MAIDLTSSNDPFVNYVLEHRQVGTSLSSIHQGLVSSGIDSLSATYVIFHALLINHPEFEARRVTAFQEIISVWPQFNDFTQFFNDYIDWVQSKVNPINPLDNEETKLYKIANFKDVPRDYVYSVDTPTGVQYESVKEAITSPNARDNFDRVIRYNRNLTIEEIIFYYYSLFPDADERLYLDIRQAARFQPGYLNDKVSDYRTFLQNYESWKVRYTQERESEKKYLSLIIESQMTLTLYTPMVHETFEESSQLVRYVVETSSDPIEVFARSRPRLQVPFISYEGEEQVKTYLYEGDRIGETMVPFSDFIQAGDKSSRIETIYFTINLHDDKLHDGSSNYIKCRYVARDGYIEINVGKGQRERILLVVRETFPMLNIVSEEVLETKGQLRIPGLTVIDHILHNLTVNQPIFSRYFYIDESDTPMSEKKKSPKLRYRSTVMGDESDDASGKVKSVASVSYSVSGIDTDAPLLELTVKARENIREQFIEIILRAFRFYSLIEPERIAFFNSIVPDGSAQIRTTGNRYDEVREKKVKDIEAIIPDMPDYSRSCQCKVQPVILGDDEVEEWLNETKTALEPGGPAEDGTMRPISRYYQIKIREGGQERLEYDMVHHEDGVFAEPPLYENEVSRLSFNVTCSGEYPHRPSLIKRLGSNGNERYPCCNKTGTIRTKQEAGRASYHRVSGSARTGQTGELSPVIIELLRHVDPPGSNREYVRNGSPDPTSSILHCILIARQESNYLSLKGDEQRQYINQLRVHIATQVTPWVYKQELFDLEADQISRNIADPEVSLDPYLYFRGLEIYFGINIFVFLSDTVGSMEIPRNRTCHIRTYRPEQPSIIIAKVKESSYCELITRRDVSTEEMTGRYGTTAQVVGPTTYFFGRDMTTHLYETLSKSYEAVVFSVGPQIEGRLRPFSRNDWRHIFGPIYPEGVTGQLIDPYGKTRVIEVTYQDVKIYCSIPPSQPMNVPIITTMSSAPEEIVTRLFGKPYQISQTGFWYPVVDFPTGLFVLTTHSHPVTPGVSSPPINIASQKEQTVANYVRERKQQRLASVIVQVIGWLWHLDGRPPLGDSPTSLGWWNDYIISNPALDKRLIEMSQLYRNFPSATTTAEGLKGLQTWWPYLVNDKFNLYPSLFDKLFAYFKREEEVIGGFSEDPIKTVVDGLYVWTSDFPQHIGVRFFGNLYNMEQWKKQTAALHTGKTLGITPIVREVKEEMSEEVGPTFLETDEGIFILQTVHYGELARALALCEHWEHYRKNLGRAVEPVTTSYTHIQYGIGKNHRLLPIQTYEGVSPASGFYRIVRFNQDFYGALLPLSGSPT